MNHQSNFYRIVENVCAESISYTKQLHLGDIIKSINCGPWMLWAREKKSNEISLGFSFRGQLYSQHEAKKLRVYLKGHSVRDTDRKRDYFGRDALKSRTVALIMSILPPLLSKRTQSPRIPYPEYKLPAQNILAGCSFPAPAQARDDEGL